MEQFQRSPSSAPLRVVRRIPAIGDNIGGGDSPKEHGNSPTTSNSGHLFNRIESFVTGSVDVVPVVIEVPRGTPNKYEFDKSLGMLTLDRVLHSSVFYPGDYGFVPHTLCGDGDPIDVLVLSNFNLAPGVVADCRIVGVMRMEDEKGEDEKLLAVVHHDPRSENIQDIADVPRHVKREVEHFFRNYKTLESQPGKEKWAKVTGFEGRAAAIQSLIASRENYKHKILHEQEVAEDEHRPVQREAQPPLYVHAPRDRVGIPRSWHNPRTDLYPGVVTVFIECPKGFSNKYELDHDTGFIKLDRVLHSAVFYPYDYGFVPRTLCGDGDPLDVLVLSTFPLAVGTMVDVRVIGLMEMEDEKGMDCKTLGVVHTDPRWAEVNDLDDIAPHIKSEIQNFFETYKLLEGNKWAKVTGWKQRSEAIKEVVQSAATYDENPGNFTNVPQLYHLPIGDDMPSTVNAIIECPKGSSNKYKLSKDLGLLKLDRVLHNSAFYPGNYGFIPQTVGEDSNPIDILVLSSFPLTHQSLVEVRVVALINMVDEKGPDCKIIGVPTKEPRENEIRDLDSIPAHIRKEIHDFFSHYKDLQEDQGYCKVTSWEDRDAALQKIRVGHERFFMFGVRMDKAEEKILELERENARLLARIESVESSFAARIAALEKSVHSKQ